MKIRVLYFAHLKRALSLAEEQVDLPEGATVAGAIGQLTERHPALAAAAPSLLATINEQWAPRNAPLHDGDTLGLMPPVSGG